MARHPFVAAGTVLASPITLVGLRPYSSPSCNPITGNGCPADGTPVFSSIFAQDTIANSAYNSLQASLEQRFSNGLQFEIAYTFSKSIDGASSFENSLKPICNGVLNNFSCNRSLSLFDARQRLVISYLWQIPVPKYHGAKGQLLDGWAVSGITSFQSGFPIRMLTLDDQELENDVSGFEAPGRPIETGPVAFRIPKPTVTITSATAGPAPRDATFRTRPWDRWVGRGRSAADRASTTLICRCRRYRRLARLYTPSSGLNFSTFSTTRNS